MKRYKITTTLIMNDEQLNEDNRYFNDDPRTEEGLEKMNRDLKEGMKGVVENASVECEEVVE